MNSLRVGATQFLLWALVLFLASGVARGQTGTASIYGEVTDPKGLAVVGAKVTLTSLETKASRTGDTDLTGVYLFPALPPGKYSLRVQMAGFRTFLAENIELLVNTTTKVNAPLQLGELGQTVVVSEAASPLNTTDASLGHVITPQQVMSLPLMARNPVALLSLQAGVAFSGDPDDTRSGSVNGGRSDQANVTLDGVDVNDQQTQTTFTTSLQIPLESIQEFRFTTANPTTDQGRSSGGQVAFVTKSGSNDFHGAAFWAHRNTVTTANNFINNASRLPKPKLLRNQFGGSLGGRIIRDRLFFFGIYEGNRRREESNELRIAPTETLKQGILKYTTAGGGTQTLMPADLLTIDPAGLGVNSAMLALLRTYPRCNDFSQGLDPPASRLEADAKNFCGFRFNAPIALGTLPETRSIRFSGVALWGTDPLTSPRSSFPGSRSRRNVSKTARGTWSVIAPSFFPV